MLRIESTCSGTWLLLISCPRLIRVNLGLLLQVGNSAARRAHASTIPTSFLLTQRSPNRHFGDSVLGPLDYNPLPGAMCGVTLLTWSLAIGFEDGVDKRNQRPHPRSHALDRLALGRFRAQ